MSKKLLLCPDCDQECEGIDEEGEVCCICWGTSHQEYCAECSIRYYS